MMDTENIPQKENPLLPMAEKVSELQKLISATMEIDDKTDAGDLAKMGQDLNLRTQGKTNVVMIQQNISNKQIVLNLVKAQELIMDMRNELDTYAGYLGLCRKLCEEAVNERLDIDYLLFIVKKMFCAEVASRFDSNSEACRILDLSLNTLKRWISRKDVKAYQKGQLEDLSNEYSGRRIRMAGEHTICEA